MNFYLNQKYDYFKVIVREGKRKSKSPTDAAVDMSDRYARMEDEPTSQIDRDLRELELNDVVLNPVT